MVAGTHPVADRYMFDLNDSLFTRGYQVDYYFSATDNNGITVTLPRHAADGVYFEFTCLPTLASDILYVDDFDGRGTFEGTVQQYFDPAFRAVLPTDNQPDRYDVNGPSSLVSNGPGSRAKLDYFKAAYNNVIWDSGNLDRGTICDGTAKSDKSDDCSLLVDWLNTSEHDVGLWVLGDNVAYDFANNLSSTQSVDLMQNWCGTCFLEDSYPGAPFVTGDPEGIFYHNGAPDKFYIYGTCPARFDCLDKNGTSSGDKYALDYPDYNGTHYYAGIQNTNLNGAGYTARTMWFGFSFMTIRDIENSSPPIRFKILKEVVDWFENTTNPDITGDETPAVYSLAQNVPNPFNPSTTIRFNMKAKGHVSLKVYNVAGRLVKTLADGVFNAGSHSVDWDGTNNSGARVASGIYFYKMETRGFKRTKKMVLLR
ncbi:hypothetical protein DRQ05_00760 [bacterium]|nr:MAG: hypothetical protein DRQ05_00760 [bacterium]